MAANFFVLLHLLFAHLVRCQYDKNEIFIDPAKHDEEFFSFRSRPDVQAPRWDSVVHNASALAPGYWFLSPYIIVEQTGTDGHTYVAPAIYDSTNGELVWNGGRELDYRDVFSLQVVKFGGVDMMAFLVPEEGDGIIMNDLYGQIRHVRTGNLNFGGNMHEFQIVDGGKRALFLTTLLKYVSRERSLFFGFDGECHVDFLGIEERDIDTGAILFSWDSEGHITFDESYAHPIPEGFPNHDNIENCANPDFGLDYLHGNSVDKLPDGDYLLSARHTYAIYKISHIDGSIVWRLGGKKSDFTLADGVHFSAQHDARCLFQNATHMTISLMDNAVGVWPDVGDFSNPNSRGLVLSINTDTMVATEVAHYDHPDGPGNYALERGSLQTLPNGNTFVTWTSNAHHSEYTADGTLVADAKLLTPLKTYRSYKFPWMGHARHKPDVYSEVVAADEAGGELRTDVYVSWNGDTMAARWILYATDASGDSAELLNRTERTGFETLVSYKGFLPFVKVDALDRGGNPLERSGSDAVQTIFTPGAGAGAGAPAAFGIDPATENGGTDHTIASDGAWSTLGELRRYPVRVSSGGIFVPTHPVLVFFGGIGSALLLQLGLRKIRWSNVLQRMRGGVLYAALGDDDEKGHPS